MARGSSARGRRVARRAALRKATGEQLARDLAKTAAIEEIKLVAGFAAIADSIDDEPAPPAEWIDTVVEQLVAAGVEAEPQVRTSYELTSGSLAEREFLSQVILAGFDETNDAAWPCEGDLADHGEVLYREQGSAVFRLDDGSLVWARLRYGWFHVDVASSRREQAAEAVASFSALYPPLYRDSSADGEIVPITFWTNGKFGPTSRLRMIDSATWSEIDGNYSGQVREELGRLMGDFEPGKDGQLLLWQGSPGTGKTWALRALATEWRSWAEFNYITDPDSFFVGDPSYMINVLLSESYEELTVEGDVVSSEDPGGKWRVLILEDTGELLSANAKETYGQGLSRLLNVVDGMVGQGLRILAIVTTNDELDDLHPAVTRPGRCASQISFGPLSQEESAVWLSQAADGTAVEVDGEKSLAELYEIAGASAKAEFADGMSGECSCGHMAIEHAGPMNDGACAMEQCDCQAFEPGDGANDTAALLAMADRFRERAIQPAQLLTMSTAAGFTGNTTLTFTHLNGETLDLLPGLPAEHQPADTAPAQTPGPVIVPAVPVESNGTVQWSAILAPEGQATDDGRVFAPGAIEWRELPLSLMAMIETQEGHDGAQVCGRIDRIWRDEASGLIMGAGEFDTGEYGAEIARLVADGTLRGVSVDIAIAEMEIAYRGDVLDENGDWLAEQPALEGEGPSMIDVLFGEDTPTVFVVKRGIIGAATVCPFPAFAQAQIEVASSLITASGAPNVWTATGPAGWRLTASRSAQERPSGDGSGGVGDPDGQGTGSEGGALTASAAGIAPEVPPAAWFQDPELTELTPLTVGDDGRIYGHAAAWGTCHIGIPGGCTVAPYSETNYAYFLLKEVVCEDGIRVPCGTVTLDTGHAGKELGRQQAASHYDDTGTAVADIQVGEDDHGIWVAGALRADADADLARKLRGSSLSGDWRSVNGNLELVALLAVNVPGFPVPRPSAALVASGDGFLVTALVAAGVTTEEVADRHNAEVADAFAAIAELSTTIEPEPA